MIILVQNAAKHIGIHSVGMMWLKIVVLGIVIYVENVEIGGNGTALTVINAHME